MAATLRPAPPEALVPMSGIKRVLHLFWVVVPFLAVVAAIVLLWNRAVGTVELAVMAAMYVPTMLGITVGFHRLFTHHAFETTRTIKYALAICGSMAIQGPVVRWVAEHVVRPDGVRIDLVGVLMQPRGRPVLEHVRGIG